MNNFLIALQFLTIIPIRHELATTEDDIAKSSSAFVLVGLVQGVLLVATDYLARRVFHPDLVTGLILLMMVLINGGFHLDGISDTFDALAVKSQSNARRDMERRLEIMKAGAAGPIGVTAIIFALALKYLALNNISLFQPFIYRSSLLLMPVMSKWAMVISMYHGKSARDNGLGKIFIDRTGLREFGLSTITLLLSLICSLLLFNSVSGFYVPNKMYMFYVVLLPAIYLFCRSAMNFFDGKFGGLTGDVLGALGELTEIIFLFMVIIWSRFFI